MIKKILIIAIIFLLAGSAGAYTIGQIINQNQVNAQDFLTHDLDFSVEFFGLNEEKTFVILEVDYTTLKQLDVNGIATGEYEIVRKTRTQQYSVLKYYLCTLNDTASNCFLRIKNNFKHNIKVFRKNERLRLNDYKTTYMDELSSQDFSLTVSDFE